MLAEMARNIGPKEYPEIVKCDFCIYLVEASQTLLGTMTVPAQKEATSVLTHLGVVVKLNTAVKDYVDGQVILSNGETIPTHALIWTSGVVGCEVKGLTPNTFRPGRRIAVDEFCKVKGTKNIFAIGDISVNPSDQKYSKGFPQVAQVAIQQGKFLGTHLKRLHRNKPIEPFVYRDKGSMAIISKYKAVADLPGIFVKGAIAWLIWLFIHLIPLAGFRNKVRLAFSWAWSFITDDPTLRLIIRPQFNDLPKTSKTKTTKVFSQRTSPYRLIA